MQKHVQRPATYDDLLRVPDHLVAEIIDGELYTNPRPAMPHARATSSLGAIISSAFDLGTQGPGGWWILDEPELHFSDDVLVPDIAGWRRERMPELHPSAFFDLAPDWACEVVSPSSGRLDRVRKMPIYAREGVAWLWLVEPLQRTVEVYRLEAGAWGVAGTHGGAETARITPFEVVDVDMRRWWVEA